MHHTLGLKFKEGDMYEGQKDKESFKALASTKVKAGVCTGCGLFADPQCEDNLLKQTDVLIVGAFPMQDDVSKGVFRSMGGRITRNIIQDVLKDLPNTSKPSVAYTYAVKCYPESAKFKPSVEVVEKCSQFLSGIVERTSPKIVVTLGSIALRGTGCKQTFSTVRGHPFVQSFGDFSVQIMPTFHPAEVMKAPGKTVTFSEDIRRAFDLAMGKQEIAKTFELDLPIEASEVVATLAKIKTEIEESPKDLVPVAIDVETTGLEPQNPVQRMIMVSLSHRVGYGMAFPFEHRQKEYTPEELQGIRDGLQAILTHPKVQLGGHNIKFDTKWIRFKYVFQMPPPVFDTMLIEHLLDEDKKGLYSLKDLTLAYFPEFGKYEKELHGILDDLQKKFNEEASNASKQYREDKRAALINHFYSQDDQTISRQIAEFVNAGFITITDGTKLMPTKTSRNKKTGEFTKTFLAKTYSVLNRVPDDRLPRMEGEPPEKARKVTFEDVPLPVLIRYAAMDALLTMGILQLQVKGMTQDWVVVKEAEKELQVRSPNYVIDTKPLGWPLKNIIMPMSDVISDMEYNGIKVDRDLIRSYISILEEKIAESEEIMKQEIGYPFNPASSPDLQKILFEDLGYTPIKESQKTQLPSTDADVLNELNRQKESPFLTQLLGYRKLTKCKSTYLENWLKMSEKTGKIHCNFNLNGTATGRLSSSSPNLYVGGCKSY